MSSSYLFQSKGLVELASYLTPDTLFAFDLDGTLAPIVENRSDAAVSEPIKECLQRLIRVAKVSVLTGRSRKDALCILGIEPHLVIGNHGAELPTENGDRNWSQIMDCLKWREALYSELSHLQGVDIEYKGESLAVHYRAAEDQEKAISLIDAAIRELAPPPRVIGGKCVVNVLPREGASKGKALTAAIAKFGSKRAVYFGDDVTDEDVFRLEGVDVFGIRIGEDEETAATYHLKDQPEILGLLHSIAAIMEMLWTKEKEEIWELP